MQTCLMAVEKHSWEHARAAGQWIMSCAEGWCGCAKSCGEPDCPICPTQDGPA